MKPKWRMTYTNKEFAACSARGIATRETKEELEALAEKLKEVITDVKIEPILPKKPSDR
jgi:hypothetical protein